ncbi:hypothetical protein RB195_023981 [Necator americanus]|uniref:Uncharacterized protein n=1 Tax=Necator americanus TaxID=51031 RepID=A0ABR1EM67_NECAM
MRAAWAAFAAVREATNQLTDQDLRAHLFDSTVLPALCYAAETWADTTATSRKLLTTHKALRNVPSCDPAEYVSKAKHRWPGHIMRRIDDRWTKRTLEWISRDAKRPRARPPTRWGDVFPTRMDQLRAQLDTAEGPRQRHSRSLRTSWMTMARERREHNPPETLTSPDSWSDAFKSIEDVLKWTKNIRLRAQIFNTGILRALTYASETCVFRKREENAISVTECASEGIRDAAKYAKESKIRWARQVMRQSLDQRRRRTQRRKPADPTVRPLHEVLQRKIRSSSSPSREEKPLSNPYARHGKMELVTLDEVQLQEQAGSRQLHRLHPDRVGVTEVCREYRLSLVLTFVDHEKAFVCVETNAILSAPGDQCEDVSVRQGDTVFAEAVEITGEDRGVPIQGKILSKLRFAYDIVLEKTRRSKDNAQRIKRSREENRLPINGKKTQFMKNVCWKEGGVQLEGSQIMETSSCPYLTRYMNMESNMKEEVNIRMRAAYANIRVRQGSYGPTDGPRTPRLSV